MLDELIRLANENEGFLQALAMLAVALGVVLSPLRRWAWSRLCPDPKTREPDSGSHRVKLFARACGHTFFATWTSVLRWNEAVRIADIVEGLAIDHPCHGCGELVGAVACVVSEVRP